MNAAAKQEIERIIAEHPEPVEKVDRPVSDDEAEAALKTLNVGEKMTVLKQKALAVWGKYSTQDSGVGPPLLTTSFHSLFSAEAAMSDALAASRADGVTPEEKAKLLSIVAQVSKNIPLLADSIMELEAKIKKPTKSKGGKNAPPNMMITAEVVNIGADVSQAPPQQPKPIGAGILETGSQEVG